MGEVASPQMDYLLRKISDDVWRRAKAAAALRGVTIREILLTCLAELAKTTPANAEPKTKKGSPRSTRS